MSLHIISLHTNEEHEVDSMGIIATYPFDFTREKAKEAFVAAISDFVDVNEDDIDVLHAAKDRIYFFYTADNHVYQALLSKEE